MKKLLKNQKGFTIIEVMIVLVIAAVILLIVFLAVPALQRNSRNTQLKNDAARILSSVSEFQNNNNGTMPTGVNQVTGSQDVSIDGATGTTSVVVKVSGGTVVALGTATTIPTATGTIHVFYNKKCTSSSAVSGTTTNRAVAVGYQVEGNSNSPQCQES